MKKRLTPSELRKIDSLAVDIPSGLDAETGIPNSPTIKADFTATFFAEKTGFVNPLAKSCLGNDIILGIGVPNDFINSILPITDKPT